MEGRNRVQNNTLLRYLVFIFVRPIEHDIHFVHFLFFFASRISSDKGPRGSWTPAPDEPLPVNGRTPAKAGAAAAPGASKRCLAGGPVQSNSGRHWSCSHYSKGTRAQAVAA